MLFTLELAAEQIGELKTHIKMLEAKINLLESENLALRIRNDELQEKLGLNSKNSSIPSSKDFYKAQESRQKSSSGRKRGGQVGHQGYFRSQLSADEVVNVEIDDKICQCGGELALHGKAHIHQTVDIPQIYPHVINYQLNKYRCNKCGNSRKARLPEGVSGDTFGDNLSAIISSLTACYKSSKRDVQNILRDMFNLNISLGSISNKEGKVSEQCRQAYEDLELQVNNSDVVHIDETGHSNRGKRGWCWIFASSDTSYIKLEQSRGQKVLKNSAFGPSDSIYVTDRYSAYNYLDRDMRQICWAHLRRDFARFAASRNEEVRRQGVDLEQVSFELFDLLDSLFAKGIDEVKFRSAVKRLRKRSWQALKEIAYLPDAPGATGKAKCIMKFEDMMWKFLEDPYNIPLTNNHAEQQIRHYVVYRKTSFFTQSDRGDRFLERLMSLFLTWKKRGFNPFEKLSLLVSS